MQPKIALVGAHGVGKTTLLQALDERLRAGGVETRLMPEIPRMICDAVNDPAFFRRGKNTLLKQTAIIVGQLVLESQSKTPNELLLCDRTVLDHWAYTRTLFDEELHDLAGVAAYEELLRRHCATYNQVFYVPIEFGPKDDGTRESDPAFQREIDAEIARLLTAWSVPYTTVTGTVAQRANAVLEHVSAVGVIPMGGIKS